MVKRSAKSANAVVPEVLQADRERLAGIPDLRDRILACGYLCFDNVGVDRTSVELLCEMASISRPSFYRYFDNKQAMLEHIEEIESLKVRSEVRRRIGHHDDFEEMLVEALYLIERAAQKNKYVSGFLFSVDIAARAARRGSGHIERQMEWWGPFVERAIAKGRVAPDLAAADVISWLNACMVLLMVQQRVQRRPAGELKAYIRRYLVRPLLPQSAG